jgi:hypothetical protein
MYVSITRLQLKNEEPISTAVDAVSRLLAEARGVAGFRDCYVVQTPERTHDGHDLRLRSRLAQSQRTVAADPQHLSRPVRCTSARSSSR